MFCGNCGNEIKEGDSFCGGCGSPVVTNKEMVNQSPQMAVNQPSQMMGNMYNPVPVKNSSKKWMLVLIPICTVLIVLVVYFINKAKDDASGDGRDSILLYGSIEKKDEVIREERTEIATVAATTELAETTEVTEVATEEAPEIIAIEDYTRDDCEALIVDLKKQEFSSSTEYDILYDLSAAYISTKIINEEGQVLSKLPDDQKVQFDYSIIEATYDSNSVLSGQLNIVNNTDCSLDEAEALFYDVYGCNQVPDLGNGYGLTVNGDWLTFYMASGDSWNNNYNASVQQLGDYYLLTTPYFYGDNSRNGEELLGYGDILFVKNPESRFGVTMLYAKAYKKEISIDHIQVSSELEPEYGNYYYAQNLYDGNYTTAWVEGVVGVGVGETITIYLKEPTLVYGTLLYNGYYASVELYNKNGKVTATSTDFGDGQKVISQFYTGEIRYSTDEMLKDDYDIENIYSTTPVVTDKIVITIEDGVAGLSYDDTCISELKVY